MLTWFVACHVNLYADIMKQIKAKSYYTQQFQRIQQQTNMGRSLFFSNVAPRSTRPTTWPSPRRRL